jgi:hypothetical protein
MSTGCHACAGGCDISWKKRTRTARVKRRCHQMKMLPDISYGSFATGSRRRPITPFPVSPDCYRFLRCNQKSLCANKRHRAIRTDKSHFGGAGPGFLAVFPSRGRRRLLIFFSTTTCFVRPWLKLWRSFPYSSASGDLDGCFGFRSGCFSFRSALASIWRMRSRATENCWPTSSSVWSVLMPMPKRMRSTCSSRGVNEASTRVVVPWLI